ncbi:30S ribosome-binding factor RbfA [Flavobacterium sp. SUN052]|uniref:30S ribosome-binding factor RbfA n=1 Tax=Flavobacterium sp. SUN052 TaxID=3002441 RepID=UPI00237E0987|nr:30S ribosome-binding factor RbfA [Flavobacterium sp. SUN052]MEC4004193.1 30S ribosome-binding factor RbfA [Flavobacterium sp. SUN052]
METNRQKKIGSVLQNDLVDILQGEVRKNGLTNLIISVSKVVVTTDLGVARVYLSVFPQNRAQEILEAVKSNAPLIKHDLSQRVKLQLRKVPNLSFYIDDSLDYIEKIDNALKGEENPIENRELLEKRKKS